MTATLCELGLTPPQRDEVDALEPAYVDAWLDALTQAGGVKSPTGWFLAGVRSGRLPGETADADKARKTRQAEAYIRNAACYEPTEESLLEGFFGDFGSLRAYSDDRELRARLVEAWREWHPRAEQADREASERAELRREARATLEDAALAELGKHHRP